MRSNVKKARVQRRPHANFAPKSREKIAKFSEIRRASRTICAQKLRASGRHALRILHNVAEMERVSSACRSEKAHVEITHIVRQNREKELQNFGKIVARRAHRSCVHSACVAKKSNAISEALEQITSALPSKKRAVGVEITQSFAQKSRERIAEFLEVRRAARTIFASNRSVCVTQTSELRCSCLSSRQSVQMQKTRECSSREHANFP